MMTEIDVSDSDVSSDKTTEQEVVSSNATVLEGVAANLIHGSSNQTGSYKPIKDRTNDPIWYVERFRKHREQSVREVVHSTIAVCEGLDAIGDDKTEFRRFVTALADAKVMSQAEAKKPKRADMSTLSKIQKIYEHRDIILHQSVADKLCTGYSVLYELALLIDQLMPEAGEVAEKVADVSSRLSEHLETLDGDLTRRWIKGVRENVGSIPSRDKKHKPDTPVEGNAVPNDAHNYDQQTPNSAELDNEDDGGESEEVLGDEEESGDDQSADEEENDITSNNEGSVHTPGHQLAIVAANDRAITAALLIVGGPWDDDALSQNARSEKWREAAAQVAEDSVVFVFSPLRYLLEISQTIETFAYWRCSRVYMLSRPDDLDVSDCDVLAIYNIGLGVSIPGLTSWTTDDTPNVITAGDRPEAIAEQLATGLAGRLVQFFGDTAVPGWETLAPSQQ
jgi:hypothetical protein